MISTLPIYLVLSLRYAYSFFGWVAVTGYLLMAICKLLLIHQVKSLGGSEVVWSDFDLLRPFNFNKSINQSINQIYVFEQTTVNS